MTIDAATWDYINELFDDLADLDAAQRQRRLADLALDEATGDWLRRLLAAHDSSDQHLLDQTLSRVVTDLVGDDSGGGEIPDRMDGLRLGNWRVGQAIAHGAQAAVFHGERADEAYEQHVAIKLLRPGRYRQVESEQLREELRLLARLEHPGIARLIDGGISEQGWPYLVMEYVDGLPIDQWCAEHQLDLRQRLRLIVKVCDAVGYAHSQLVVHADIKPSNVLVNRNGEPKLVDFGIAGLLRPEREASAHPESFLLRCSPAYAAPEQLRGEPVSTLIDVFGVGAMLYELLVGRRIRDGRTVTALLLSRDERTPIALPSQRESTVIPVENLRGDIDAICARALALDPQQRYREIELLQKDLNNYLQQYPVQARPATKAYLLSRWLARHRLGAGLATLLVISLLVGLTVSIRQTILANENARKAQSVTEFLLTVFDAEAPGDYESPLQVPRRDLAVRAAAELDLMLPEQPEARVELMLALGRVLRKMSLTDQARPLLQQAISEIESDADRGRDSMRVAAWFELGQIESLEERMTEAAEAFRRADVIAQGMNDPPVERAANLFQLGRVLSASGQFGEALEALNEAAHLAANSDRSMPLLPRISLLSALTLSRAGRFSEALTAGEQAVEQARAILGPDHERTASALSTVGGMLRIAGRLDQAEAMLREAYEIGVRSYGQPDYAVVNNLARLLETRGNLIEAESFQTEALSLVEARRGPNSPASARVRRNLAMIQALQKNWTDALDNLRQAVDVHRQDTSLTHYYTVFMRSQLAWVQLQSGRSDQVRASLPELLDQAPALRDRYPREAVWIHMLAAEFELREGQPQKALEHVEAIDALVANSEGRLRLDNWEQVQLPFMAGSIHAAAQDPAAAQARWLEARARAETMLGPRHPLRQDLERRLGN